MTTLKEKMASRKFSMAMYVLIASTLILSGLPLLGLLASTNIVVLSGTEWVSLVLGIYGLYVGGNVVTKKFNNSVNNVVDPTKGED